MEIVLERHGQPEWVRDGLNVTNPPLTALGRTQAERAADVLAREDFAEVLVSPLQRARQTAAPLYSALDRTERVEPWLEEIRDPSWHGTPAEKAERAYAEMRGRRAVDRWNGLEGGESIRDFTARIHRGVTDFLEARGVVRVDDELPVWRIANPDQRILLVAHAGTNSVVISHLLGLQPTPWEWERFVLGHTSISRLVALELGDGFTFSLTKLSDVEHLAAGERSR